MLFWSVLAAAVAALSLGPSFAHMLESGPRLYVWSPELWREATVFNQQFMLRGDGPAFGFALGATVLFARAR